MPSVVATSVLLQFITPTSYERIRACPLHQAFHADSIGPQKAHSAVSALGIAAHGVFETMLKSGSLMNADWSEQLEVRWQSAIRGVEEDTDATGWPNYQLTRARLEVTLEALRDDLSDVAQGDLFPEVDLGAKDGLLRGRADLVIRGMRHEVIDFKTGAALEKHEAVVRAGYARQLAIYSYLEAQASAAWPRAARIISLTGIDATIEVEPQACEAEAVRAVDELEQYNSRVPGEQPAYPSPEACGFCPYAARCPAFWQDKSAMESVGSITGIISAIQHSEMGGAAITLEVEGGSLQGGQARIYGIQPSEYPRLYWAEPGNRAWVAGVWQDARRNAYRLSRPASVEVSADQNAIA